MSDKKISEAVELLYKGAKMLAYHCPECKMPLFEKDGKIFCPSCGREAVFESKLKDIEAKKQEKEVEEKKEEKILKVDVGEDSLVRIVEKSAIKICEMIINSENVADIKVLVDSLEKLVNIMDKVRNL